MTAGDYVAGARFNCVFSNAKVNGSRLHCKSPRISQSQTRISAQSICTPRANIETDAAGCACAGTCAPVDESWLVLCWGLPTRAHRRQGYCEPRVIAMVRAISKA